MGKLRDLQKRSRQLVKDWPKIQSQAIEDNKEIALDLITDDQLFDKGIDGDGNKLPLPYAPFTVQVKKALGLPTDRITLKQTGGFHGGVFGKLTGNDLITGSTDSKSDDLHKEWGQSITSLTKENTAKWAREDVLPDVQDMAKKRLGI